MDQRGQPPWRLASSHFQEFTPKQRREEELLQPFYEEQRRQENARRSYELKNIEAASQMCKFRRNLIHQTFLENVRRNRMKELCEVSMHASILASWNTLENQEYATKVNVYEKISSQHELLANMDWLNFVEDLKAFEGKGYALGEESKPESCEANNRGKEKRKDNTKTVKESKGSRKAKSDGKNEREQDLSDPLVVIKERVLKAEKERMELEQKKRLDTLAEKQRNKEIEEAMRIDEEDKYALKEMQEKLLKEEETQKAEIQERERRIVRLELEQQIAEQRNREWEAVLARDRELLLMMKHDRDNDVNFEQRIWQEEKLKKLEQTQLKHKLMCQDILYQIVTLAENFAFYKESTNCALSSMEWWEWKVMFVKGAVPPVVLGTKSSSENDVSDACAFDAAEEELVMNYIKEKGEWEADERAGTNKELGKILVILFKVLDITAKPVPPPFLSCIQLKVATIGSPFTGKTFLAKELEDRFGIVRIDIEKVLASAIAAGEMEDSKSSRCEGEGPSYKTTTDDSTSCEEKHESEESNVSNISPRTSLARQAQAALRNGSQVPDEVIVKLLLLTLENIDDYALQEMTPLTKDKKKKDQFLKMPSPKTKSKEVGSQKSSPSLKGKIAKDKPMQEINGTNKRSNRGFILDGFPSTRSQAILLEKALHGEELSLKSNEMPYVSKIAPPPDSDMKEVDVDYPLDLLFAMEPLSEGDALKQAMSMVKDPKSGIVYHLDYDPPPSNDRTGIAGRLKHIEDINSAGKRIKEAMPSWQQLYEWISTFSNVHIVCRDQERKMKVEDVYIKIQEILDAKEKVAAAEDAAKAAVEADMAATQSCIEAEKACIQAQAIAQKLFLSKLAELEAFSLLERPSSDKTAKDMLKKKVSESTSQLLQDAAKAAKEAEGFSEAARKAADDALHAKLVAEEAVSSISTIRGAKEEALAAAVLAKQSMGKACIAAQKAQVAAETALVNVRDMNSTYENSDKSMLKEKISSLSTNTVKNVADVKITKQETDAESDKIEYTFADNLCRQWKDIETTYLARLKEVFGNLRTEWRETQKDLKEVMDTFVVYLKKPDERQNYVNDFQGKYKRIDASQRLTLKMKKQLQKKAEDLFSKLHSICDSFSKEARSTLEKGLTDWKKKRLDAISPIFVLLIQIELERFLNTCCFLHEYHFKASTMPIREKLNKVTSSSNVIKQSKLLSMPGWFSSISESLPQLRQALQQAMFSADLIAKTTTEPQNTSSKTSSKTKKASSEAVSKELQKREECVSASKVIQDEKRILISRLEKLASKACGRLHNVEALVDGARTLMQNWTDKFHKEKVAVTEEVINIVQEAIAEGIPLWFYMCVEGENLTIDESQVQMDLGHPTTLYPLPDLSTYHNNVLEEIVKTFRTESVKGYTSLERAANVVSEAIDRVHATCRTDRTFATIPHMPGTRHRPGGPFEVWRDYSKVLIKMNSTNRTEVLDWRSFVVSLMDVHYDNFISNASVNDIIEAYLALQEASHGCDSCIELSEFLGVKPWFESDDASGAVAKIKTLLHYMLDSGGRMPWKALLMYLCKDSNTELALKKAYAALTGSLSENVSLTSSELLQVIYPCGIEDALETGCSIWSLQDLEKLMEGLQKKQNETDVERQSDDCRTSNEEDGDSNVAVKSTDSWKGSKLSSSEFCVESEIQSSSGKTIDYESTVSDASNLSRISMSGTEKATAETSASEEFNGSAEFSANALATMNDFLAACDETFDCREDAKEGTDGQEKPTLQPVTLEDLLASDISSTLHARFAADSVLTVARAADLQRN